MALPRGAGPLRTVPSLAVGGAVETGLGRSQLAGLGCCLLFLLQPRAEAVQPLGIADCDVSVAGNALCLFLWSVGPWGRF